MSNAKSTPLSSNQQGSPLANPTSLGRSSATEATPTPLPPQTTQTQPTGNPCNTLPLWSPSSAYIGGSKVVYQQKVWTAAWWTYGDVPGGTAGVWSLEKSYP